MRRMVPLEKEAEQVCSESAKPPLIFHLPIEEGRKRLEKAQDTPPGNYPAHCTTIEMDTGEWGKIDLHCIRPEKLEGRADVIFYIHGAGWVFGSLHTHEKLVCELAARTGAVVFFPEYSRAPEAKYPVALEQCYHALCRLPEIAAFMEWDVRLAGLTVAGDSVGGNMATVMTMLAKQRGGPKIHKQLLYYPVTNAGFDTASYNRFAVDYHLYRAGMKWFWNQYLPDVRRRSEITASPLLAGLEELRGLPPAMLLNGEADLLRDEGEAYARKLRKAGVEVTAIRYQATIHDFVMLNALDQTAACRAAMDASTGWLRRKNRALW